MEVELQKQTGGTRMQFIYQRVMRLMSWSPSSRFAKVTEG